MAQVVAVITGQEETEPEMKSIWYVKLPDGRIARDDGTLYVVVGQNEGDRAWLDDVYTHGGRWRESSPGACDGPWKCDIRNPGLNMGAEPYLELLPDTTSREYPPPGGGVDGATLHAAG